MSYSDQQMFEAKLALRLALGEDCDDFTISQRDNEAVTLKANTQEYVDSVMSDVQEVANEYKVPIEVTVGDALYKTVTAQSE